MQTSIYTRHGAGMRIAKQISRRVWIILSVLCFTATTAAWAQDTGVRFIAGQDTTKRPIVTSVPFLALAPDAQAASMGDIGVATTPNVNAVHWNNAKLAFIEAPQGASFSYTPWLSTLVDDMYIVYLAGYTKIRDIQAVGVSLRYFNLGDIFLTNEIGADAGTFSPRDFAADISYARKLNPNLGLGLTMRFVNSNLSRSYEVNNDGEAASGYAVDLGLYYTNPRAQLFNRDLSFSWGVHLSNVGTKLSYGDENNESFMPANLRLGTALKFPLDGGSALSVALDFNKLLVPTPPVYATDDQGNLERDEDGNLIISEGEDPDRSVLSSLLGSLGDAPDGLSEELQEISTAFGLQYSYRDFFSVQTGYHHESAEKGNRKYFTLGAGFRYNVFGVDFAYLLPTAENHPLAQTLRFSLYLTFGQDSFVDDAQTPSPAP